MGSLFEGALLTDIIPLAHPSSDEGSGTLPLTRTDDTVVALPWNAKDAELSCHVTTHRIVLIDERDVVGGSIPLPLVQTARPAGGPSFRSPRSSYKVELSTHAWGELTIVFRGGETCSYTDSSKHRDDALAAIQISMQRKAWNDKERQAMKEALRTSTAIAARRVGVDAILTKNALRGEYKRSNAQCLFLQWKNSYARPLHTDRENANLVDLAFGGSIDELGAKTNDKGSKKEDIDAFLREATELVKVIHKYSATIERERAAASAVNPGEGFVASGKDADKLFGMMENMGITSALSEKQAGSAYHKQLARQLVDFLRLNDKLTKAGGMMTLTDVYCLFNRARGTNMISPEDLLKAVDLMKELNLGISKRSFSSGVLVIQADEFDDVIMGKKLTEMASTSMEPQSRNKSSSPGGITVMDVCRALKMSALLANEQLLTAEQMGLLCRDSTIEGVRFFPNLFDSGDFSLCLPSLVK